jgi:hypothetical protein
VLAGRGAGYAQVRERVLALLTGLGDHRPPVQRDLLLLVWSTASSAPSAPAAGYASTASGHGHTMAPGRRHVAFVAGQPEKRRSETIGDQQMSATLKVTHKAIGAEVRRGPYDVVVDGERAGSVEMNHTIEIPVEPGRHTLQVRNGRNSSGTETFDAADEEIVAFLCTGKRFLPIFLASFAVPRLALKLVRV